MESKEYSIIHRVRDIPNIPVQISKVSDLEKSSVIEVQTNMGGMPIEDYREIVASQSGFDSYDEMYHQGYRIGNGYDK